MTISYYEQGELWDENRFLDESQQRRFNLTAQLIPEKTTSVLDVGTGNGAFLKYLEDHGPKIPVMFGVEPARVAVERKICRSEIHQGSIASLPFPDASFDLVSALEVIEHLPFGVFEKGLQEIQRVAARYILISVPHNEKRVKVRCPYCGCEFNPHYHMRSFSNERLAHLFEAFQLKEIVVINKEYRFGPDDLIRIISDGLRARSMKEHPLSMCPQCGFSLYQKSALIVSMGPRHSANVSRLRKRFAFLKPLLPRVGRKVWSIALYVRKNDISAEGTKVNSA